MTDFLDLEPVTISYRRMVWTLEEVFQRWTCGPVEVAREPVPGNRDRWVTKLKGKIICRPYGYASAKDAMFAAVHLGPVVRLREKTP